MNKVAVVGRQWGWTGLGALAFALSGCGAETDSVATPYAPGEATVVGVQQGSELTTVAEACAELDCSEVEERCGDDAAADIIVNDAGEVVDVICYKQDVNVESAPVEPQASAEAGNNTVLVLDGEDDGEDIEGDVTISGNNAIVYGEGPATSVIGGTVKIEKNNAIVRGVRILEDVTITKNNAQLAFCEILGDLTITGNNTTLAECVVHGSITIKGNNTVLVENTLASTQVAGFNLTCNGNHAFDDADGDQMVDAEEIAEAEVVCTDAEGHPEPQSEVPDAPEADAGALPAADAAMP